MVTEASSSTPRTADGASRAGPSNLLKPLAAFEAALQREFEQLVQHLEHRRLVQGSQEPLSRADVDGLSDRLLDNLPAYEGAADIVKARLEKGLESAVLQLVRYHRRLGPNCGNLSDIELQRSPISCRIHGKTMKPICCSTMICSTSCSPSKNVSSWMPALLRPQSKLF